MLTTATTTTTTTTIMIIIIIIIIIMFDTFEYYVHLLETGANCGPFYISGLWVGLG